MFKNVLAFSWVGDFNFDGSWASVSVIGLPAKAGHLDYIHLVLLVCLLDYIYY